jgi:Omp85 superfamily domain
MDAAEVRKRSSAAFFFSTARGAAIVCVLLLAAMRPAGAAGDDSGSTGSESSGSKFRSPDDNAVDISKFLDEPYGFLPLVVPITEPAVGYGAVGALAFLQKQEGAPDTGGRKAGLGRPNITVGGGFATENNSRGWFAGDLRHWMGDRFQTLVGLVDARVNLDFYGSGRDPALEHRPVAYTLEPLGGMLRTRVRVAESRSWVGLNYALFDTQVSLAEPATTPETTGFPENSRVGGLSPSYSYDSRDTMFTPTHGLYFQGSAGFFSPTLGGDDTFQRVSLDGMWFHPLSTTLFFGVRGGSTLSFGEVPFYLKPFITLRGAPALRYQGDATAETETEVRWQFYKRWSAVGFAGYGGAWNGTFDTHDTKTVVTGGTGFRYEMARSYGLHIGLDTAWSPDDHAIYVVVGSAWMRP